MTLTGVTLFASAGIGDLALRALGVDMLVANEFHPQRAELFTSNYPETEMIVGDIWDHQDAIVSAASRQLNGRELDLLLATPPCQGMSSNGLGTLQAEIRAGNRPRLDPRNRLIIPAVRIAQRLRPRLLVFENVPSMRRTVILDEHDAPVSILEFIARELGEDYVGHGEVVEFADYGVPQRRRRLITVFTRDPELRERWEHEGSLIAPPSHAAPDTPADPPRRPWATVRSAIGAFAPLDAVPGRNTDPAGDPLHEVSVLDPKKYEWIRHTPAGRSAFDNQCINPLCSFQDNPVHGAHRGANGINQAKRDTPLHCVLCGALLPRPYTEVADGKRIMRGFVSAYKRMSWDAPAPTLTQNFRYPSSDHNVHPDQHRVLSFAEALTLHTVSQYRYVWRLPSGATAPPSLIRDSIGESVPPAGLQAVLTPAVSALLGA